MLKQIFGVLMVFMAFQLNAAPHIGTATSVHKFLNSSVTNIDEPTSKERLKVAAFRTQLLQQNWIEKHFLSGEEKGVVSRTFQFYDYGVVDIISTNQNGSYSLNSLHWHIDNVASELSLVLTEPPTGKTYITKVADFNGAMILTNKTDKSILYLAPVNQVSLEERQIVESDLLGKWVTKDTHFEFTKAGTFVNNNESGVWELTQDGQYLILYFQKTTPSQGVEVKTKVIELVSVDHQTLCLKETTANKSAIFLSK